MKKQLSIKTDYTLVKLIGLLVGLIVISLLIGFILKQNTYSLPFDRFFYGLVGDISHTRFLDNLIYIFDANFIPVNLHPQFMSIMVILPTLYIAIRKRTELRWIVIAFIVGAIISRILVFVDTTLVFRIRPWLVLPRIGRG